MPAQPTATHFAAVVFFDGECNLCNGAVNLMIDHDPAGRLGFASLQSDAARELLSDHGEVNLDDLDTVIVLAGGQVFTRSDAALRVAKELARPWSWLAVGRVVPRPLRDGVYRLIAKNRKRLVRRPTTCRMPTPDRLARFLDN